MRPACHNCSHVRNPPPNSQASRGAEGNDRGAKAGHEVGGTGHAFDECRVQDEIDLGGVPLKDHVEHIQGQRGDEDESGAVVSVCRDLQKTC